MRKIKFVQLLVIVSSLTMGLFSHTALAQQDTKKQINKAQAVKKAQQSVNGRVLKVDQKKSKYRVKVLQKSGRVVSVDVDKRTGKVTSNKKKEGY